MSRTRPQLYLVDVSALYFRAFYAIRMLTTPSGQPANAIYGFLSMTTKLLREIRPDYVAFCFDLATPSFRKALDQRYKANRSEMPEDLVPQVPWFRRLSEAMGVACFDKEGYEADDLIGSLARFGESQACDVVIVSGDKDFGQLVSPQITLYDTMKDVRLDRNGVREKWGVWPEQMIDYLAIVGDSSDNIPGVAGIGPKGAVKLLDEYGRLEEVYSRLDQIKPEGTQRKLRESRDEAFLSQKLVTIVTDLPVVQSLDELRLREIHRPELQALLDELGFKSISRQLLGNSTDAPVSPASPKPPPAPVPDSAKPFVKPAPASSMLTPEQKSASPQTVEAMNSVHHAERSSASSTPQLHGSDFEPGPFWDEARLRTEDVGSKLANVDPKQELWLMRNERGVYLGDGKSVYTLEGDPRNLAEALRGRRLSGFDVKSVAHHLELSDFHVAWDAQLASYVDRAREVELERELFVKQIGQSLPDFATPSQLFGFHFALRRVLEARLRQWDGLRILQQFELPLVPILYRMERHGILVDAKILSAQSAELAEDLQRLEKQIHETAGESFNVGSPKQLAQILFVKLGLPPGKKTKTGFSTDNEVLEGLEHPIAQHVLEWREAAKLKSTYVDALPLLRGEDGRVHTTFNQALTATGRLSSTNPNLQNIPIRTERGNRVRHAFVAPSGGKLLSADYSQIELRILAHVSGDPGLIRAFEAGHDIHAATAAEVFGLSLAEVTPEHRRRAKAINFGLAYGQGAFGLAENLGIPRGEAQKIIDRYFQKFSRVRDYMTETVEFAQKHGYVETLFGRRRFLPELSAKMPAVKKFGERAAINAPIQGAASDLVKKAMIDVDARLREQKLTSAHMLLQVHDELVFEVAEDQLADLKDQAVLAMTQAHQLKVPLVVNTGSGADWYSAHS